ncbi:MAG: hypothetical protein LHV69_12005, partial [Elusimicrobia bacterium]|nr:hypothetical protein [Candidatus Obscuribacterium magneticum]
RLACKLTGWQIDVKTESQRKQETKANVTAVKEMFLQLEGVGPRIADVLIKGGMDTVEKIASSQPEDLVVFSGIGEKLAEKMIESARKILTEPPPPDQEAEAPAEQVSAPEEKSSDWKTCEPSH